MNLHEIPEISAALEALASDRELHEQQHGHAAAALVSIDEQLAAEREAAEQAESDDAAALLAAVRGGKGLDGLQAPQDHSSRLRGLQRRREVLAGELERLAEILRVHYDPAAVDHIRGLAASALAEDAGEVLEDALASAEVLEALRTAALASAWDSEHGTPVPVAPGIELVAGEQQVTVRWRLATTRDRSALRRWLDAQLLPPESGDGEGQDGDAS